MKKLIAIVLMLSLSFALLTACDTSAAGTSAASTDVSSKAAAPAAAGMADGTLGAMVDPNDEYIVVNCLNNIEYFNAHKYGWEMAGKLFGVKTSWVGPMDDDVSAMVSAFDSAVAKKPAGIAVWGFDTALQPSIDAAMAAGIPVVTFVGDIKDSQRLSYVGSSQYDIGFNGAKLYAESIGGTGKIAIMTLPGNQMFEERQKGFEDAFAEYPGITIAGYGDTKADTVTAVSAAKDLLNSNPDLVGFVCTDSTGAIGASTAVEELGLKGKVDILGMDRNTDILQMIKDGTITASIVQDDVSMSYWAMLTLISAKYVNIPLTSDNAAAGAKVSPINIYTSVNLVTADNADYYLKANELYATNGF
ncbi:MAG: substrate-binding domain-containing protein [Eubacteriales bacterium]